MFRPPKWHAGPRNPTQPNGRGRPWFVPGIAVTLAVPIELSRRAWWQQGGRALGRVGTWTNPSFESSPQCKTTHIWQSFVAGNGVAAKSRGTRAPTILLKRHRLDISRTKSGASLHPDGKRPPARISRMRATLLRARFQLASRSNATRRSRRTKRKSVVRRRHPSCVNSGRKAVQNQRLKSRPLCT